LWNLLARALGLREHPAQGARTAADKANWLKIAEEWQKLAEEVDVANGYKPAEVEGK
jgi:hypothetical protein